MTRLTLRLPDDLHRRLRSVSQRRGPSLNDVIVAALGDALARTSLEKDAHGPLADERRHIRAVLGDLVVEVDPDEIGMPGSERGRRADGPALKLDPPLSATLIEDRRDRI